VESIAVEVHRARAGANESRPAKAGTIPDLDIAALDAAGRLPSPTGVALEIIRLCQDESAGLPQIARVAQSDPALSARLIRAANAPTIGWRRPVVAVGDALTLLGMPMVRQLSLGFSLLSENREGPCAEFDYEGFWSRSLMIALAAQLVGVRLRDAAPEELFSCGLLGNIGGLALASLYPERYAHVLRAARGADASVVLQKEREHLATDRDQLGLALLKFWGFPESLLQGIAARNDPDQAGFKEGRRAGRIAETMRFAQKLADACLASEAARRALLGPLLFASARLGFDSEGLEALSAELIEQWEDWSAIFRLSTDAHRSPLKLNVAAADQAAESECAKLSAAPSDTALVLEDDEATIARLKRVLGANGFRVEVAQDGREALRLALQERPRLAIIDWTAPQMGGLALVRGLRAARVSRGVYVIVLTAMQDDERIVEAFNAGVDDFIKKPISPEALNARIRGAMRVLAQQDELERDAGEIRRFAAELARQNRKLQEMTTLDPVSGLPNRRYGLDRLEQEWAGARRRNSPIACVVVDIDGFKGFNDRFGRETGDAALRSVATELRRNLRPEDMLCRLDGDEFFVLCRDAAESGAANCAERLCSAVAHLALPGAATGARLTLSAGTASSVPEGEDSEALLKRAERALQAAKQQIRDRIAGAPRERTDAGGAR
jgi:diguanylate cyclase (GGDEF)-like protein